MKFHHKNLEDLPEEYLFDDDRTLSQLHAAVTREEADAIIDAWRQRNFPKKIKTEWLALAEKKRSASDFKKDKNNDKREGPGFLERFLGGRKR